ncbi:MAG: ParA family protein [Saprospiraceae bacterium]|nr:ParA family protein [Saprospiraceae bacterium]
MAKIIMFGNQKGGVGKSLLTTMTATALGSDPLNLRVAVIDLDKQATIYNLRQIDKRAYPQDTPEPFTVFKFKVTDFQKSIGEIDQSFDIVLIDAAGKLDDDTDVMQQEISRALMFTDVLFIPFVAGFGNLTATYDYLNFVSQIKEIRQLQQRKLRVYGFINQYRNRSRANDFLIQDIEAIRQTEPFDVLNCKLHDFTTYKDADTITSLYNPLSNDSAKANFSEFINEIIKTIKG